jgi:hypothetical protein
MDVLWFRVARRPEDERLLPRRARPMMVTFVVAAISAAYVIAKGHYDAVRRGACPPCSMISRAASVLKQAFPM